MSSSASPWMMNFGFVDCWEKLHPGEPHPPTFRVHESEGQAPYCCDFVFATADLAPRTQAYPLEEIND